MSTVEIVSLLRSLPAGGLVLPTHLRIQVAPSVIGDAITAAIVAAVEANVLTPVYRLSDAEAWTTDLVSLRSRPGGADPSNVMVAFLRC